MLGWEFNTKSAWSNRSIMRMIYFMTQLHFIAFLLFLLFLISLNTISFHMRINTSSHITTENA
jgi:uncharacterized membrane protein